jgi:hypothetical protein
MHKEADVTTGLRIDSAEMQKERSVSMSTGKHTCAHPSVYTLSKPVLQNHPKCAWKRRYALAADECAGMPHLFALPLRPRLDQATD